jgi:hypothetical protein
MASQAFLPHAVKVASLLAVHDFANVPRQEYLNVSSKEAAIMTTAILKLFSVGEQVWIAIARGA